MANLHPMTRRKLLVQGARLATLAGAAPVLAACSSGSSTSGSVSEGGKLSGQIVMVNYPGWIGANEVTDFEKAYPRVTVKQVTEASGGNAAQAAQVAQNRGAFDMALAGINLATQLHEAGLLQPFTSSTVPNLKNIPSSFRAAYPYGIPTDQGKVGIAYRKDLLPNPPRSWAAMFKMAPSISGKIVFSNYDVDIMAIALLSLGYLVNSTNPAQLQQAKTVLIDVKPHLKAFLDTDITKPMVQGSAVLTVCYDYDFATVSPSNPHIGWIEPAEGMPGYIEGWVPLAGSSKLAEVYAFMNYHLRPATYAGFIDNTGASYLLPDATPLITKSIRNNVALEFNASANVKYEELLPAATTKLRDEIWQEVQAA
jgi:spermidine/putrescine transport system substrate-binding protein